MIEMVDRVARALAKAADDDYVSHMEFWRLYARAAIEEMRTPTKAMCVAGNIPGWDDSVTVGLSEEIWSAMIGAALTE